ncbi:hypothetical protein LI90_495 [Carbonactinospora thermoautotrophica]|uniref:Cupin type-2 domain-containing protein n=1 Tax=Carbonactinospora thermoautotrophica TaxID=1469144 RepID=A0A132MMA9_9ACTN|nr:cupin domain-containing protein [Carbonactinospora thermoautotrophica]KWW98865.1 hypothetical protein LI90_495 [Carbonactinospora thermoautotrophica]
MRDDPIVNLTDLVTAAPAERAVLWRLTGSPQLLANLVRLPAGDTVGEHRESSLDVLLLVVDGGGTATVDGHRHELTAGTLLLLPRGASRALHAGPTGLAYLTVHGHRAGGLQVGRPPADTPADPPRPPDR